MCAMHVRKKARDAYFPTRFDDVFFAARGDVAFKDTGDADLWRDGGKSHFLLQCVSIDATR